MKKHLENKGCRLKWVAGRWWAVSDQQHHGVAGVPGPGPQGLHRGAGQGGPSPGQGGPRGHERQGELLCLHVPPVPLVPPCAAKPDCSTLAPTAVLAVH